MKTMKKLLSIISAVITTISCSMPVFATAPYDDAVIIGGLGANILYDDNNLLVIENENGKFGHCTNKRYNFSMNYTVFKSDKEIEPAFFGLTDNSVLLKTESTASTETYSVVVETQEEMDKLYEAAGSLLTDNVIINGYKQFTYEYGCFYGSSVILALNEEDENFDPNSIEGLENIDFTQGDVIIEKDGKQLQSYYYSEINLNDFINIKNIKETILDKENIAEFDTIGYCVCEVWHSPNTIRIFVDEYDKNTAEAVIGDANGDTAINVRDCSFIAQNIAEGKIVEIPQNADFNEDGKVNVRDAAAIAVKLSEYK